MSYWSHVVRALLAAFFLVRGIVYAEPMTKLPPPAGVRDYMLEVYRVPAGSIAADVVCGRKVRCDVQKKGNYGFYSVKLASKDWDRDILEMNLRGQTQYHAFGFYELAEDKYFTVSFVKSGEVSKGFLMEDINFIIRPGKVEGDKLSFTMFAGFKYQLFGNHSVVDPASRIVKLSGSIDPSSAFVLIGKNGDAINEPIYIGVVRRCGTMDSPNFVVEMLGKGL